MNNNQHERPGIETIKAKAAEFGVSFDWALLKKKQDISSLMAEIRQDINERKDLLLTVAKTWEEENILTNRLTLLEKEFKNYQAYLGYLNNPKTDKQIVTDEEIERARNYPIAKFLPDTYGGKENISCLIPEHDDKHASMQVNESYLWCHTCRKGLNAIDLTIIQNGLDFKSAIKLLSKY